jgi:lysophospholipase L1-like esterase
MKSVWQPWTKSAASFLCSLALGLTACGGSTPAGGADGVAAGASGDAKAGAGGGIAGQSGSSSGTGGGGGGSPAAGGAKPIAGAGAGEAGGPARAGATGTAGTLGGGGAAGVGQGGSAAGSAGVSSGGAGGAAGGAGAGGANDYPVSDGKPTVYLAADSTVQTYAASQAPQQGWGPRIQEFFTNDVTFVNKAIGGRSSKSFIDEGRLDEIEKLLKKGDYLFCQWGINDRYMSDPARYTNPATTFRDYLKQYVEAARGKNAIPVLVTPTPRLDYSNGVFMNDFAAYCEAIKAVGAETHTPVIDLQTKALAYYTSVGYEVVERDLALDVLHFKEKGAFEMARLVAEGTRELSLPISPFVK